MLKEILSKEPRASPLEKSDEKIALKQLADQKSYKKGDKKCLQRKRKVRK